MTPKTVRLKDGANLFFVGDRLIVSRFRDGLERNQEGKAEQDDGLMTFHGGNAAGGKEVVITERVG